MTFWLSLCFALLLDSLLFWFWLSHKTQQERLLTRQDKNDFSQNKPATLTLTDLTLPVKTRHSSVKFIFGFTLLLFLDLLCLDKTTSFLRQHLTSFFSNCFLLFMELQHGFICLGIFFNSQEHHFGSIAIFFQPKSH